MSVSLTRNKPKALNQKIYYRMVEGRCPAPDTGDRTVYGIELLYQSNNAIHRALAPDICADRHSVEQLLEKMFNGSVTHTTFFDIVEDFLCERYGL